MDSSEATEPMSPAPPAGSLIGTSIGNYELLEIIGHGGMGTVYKARHRLLKRILALKIIRSKEGPTRKLLARFDVEARAASALNHQNLVGVMDYGTTVDGVPYLVMNYIEGRTLSEMIHQDGPLSQDLALEIFAQVCDGLSYAHSKRVLHRDIKPSNIMVDTSGGRPHAYLLDFGIAKVMEEEGPVAKTQLTQTGELIGSPQYMSPEQCMGQKQGATSDIYSLGCVMFEALTGKPPFAGENSVQTIFKHVNERPPLFKTILGKSTIKPEVERIVMQCLEKEPENRYHSLEDLRKDIVLVKAGRNPVKEMSNYRRTFKTVTNFCKWGSGLLLIIVLSMKLDDSLREYAEKTQPQYAKDMIAAFQQVQIGAPNGPVAEMLYKRALANAQSVKAKPSDMAVICLSLARLYQATERPKLALAQLQEALRLSSTVPNEACKGAVYNEMAAVNMAMGNWPSAQKAAEQALRIETQSLGLNNMQTENTVANLARILQEQHKLTESEQMAKKDIDICLALYPNRDDPAVANACEGMARILAAEGKKDQVCRFADAAIEVRLKTVGLEHPLSKRFVGWYLQWLTDNNMQDKLRDVSAKVQQKTVPQQ